MTYLAIQLIRIMNTTADHLMLDFTLNAKVRRVRLVLYQNGVHSTLLHKLEC